MLTGVILIVIGFFCFYGSLTRSNFFWEHPKALFLRRIIGDVWSRRFYISIGSILMFIGITEIYFFIQEKLGV